MVSSALATTVALQMLRALGAGEGNQLVQGAMDYLVAGIGQMVALMGRPVSL